MESDKISTERKYINCSKEKIKENNIKKNITSNLKTKPKNNITTKNAINNKKNKNLFRTAHNFNINITSKKKSIGKEKPAIKSFNNKYKLI